MPALVLVPSPLQASRVARRLCDAQDGVLFGPQVQVLGALPAAILAAAGDRRPILAPLAERLLAHGAGEAAGGPFSGAAPASGVAAALARAVAELRRGEVSAAAARRAAEGLEAAARERLLALAAVLAAYEDRLEALGVLDAAGAARAAAEAVRRGAGLPGDGAPDALVLDGVTALGPGEWDLVAALAARAGASRFHVPWFPERPALAAAAEPLLRRVESLHELSRSRPVTLVTTPVEDPARAGRPTALLQALGGGRPGAAIPGGELLALAAADEAGEAALAARAVAGLAARGIDPGEVALFHPAPRLAAGRLARAFAAEGIPFAAGRGQPLAEVPPVQLVRAALAAAARGLDRATAERLAGSPLAPAGLPARLGPLLERAGAVPGRLGPEAALRRRAAALAGAITGRGRGERAALAKAADGLRDLAARLAPLGAPATPGAHASRLAGFLDGSGLRRRAARGEPGLAARDLAALGRLEEAAEGLARALGQVGRGEGRLDAGAWGELLEVAVEAARLPAAGEPAGGAVELWGLDEAPGRSARAALLLGCARGAVPAPPRAEPLLREPERQAVNALLGRAALAGAGARRAEALHRVACAVAAGREVVAVAWPASAGGPAPLLAEALRAVGVVPAPAPVDPPLAEARTAAEALRAAARAVREGAPRAAVEAALGPAGLGARAAQALDRGAVEAERREAVLARRASPHAGAVAGEGLAALRARLPAEWSPTLLESHARCPFRLLAQAGCGLADPGAPGLDIDPRDEGSLLHAVMERWVAARLARGAWPPADAAPDREEARAVAEALFARFEAEGRTGDPAVWAARREAVLSRLDRIVANEAAAAAGAAGLTPALLELAFGGTSGRPPLRLEAGGEAVQVQGRLDRVDASPERLLVIDYKNARDGARHAPLLEPESFGVTSFQVPLYLLAAARELPGRRPAATYQLLRSAERLEPVEGAPDEAALAEAVVGAVRRIRQGDLPIVSRDCQGCPYGAVCRFEGVAELGEGEA